MSFDLSLEEAEFYLIFSVACADKIYKPEEKELIDKYFGASFGDSILKKISHDHNKAWTMAVKKVYDADYETKLSILAKAFNVAASDGEIVLSEMNMISYLAAKYGLDFRAITEHSEKV